MYVFMRGRETEAACGQEPEYNRGQVTDGMCQHEDPLEEAPCRVSLGIIFTG